MDGQYLNELESRLRRLLVEGGSDVHGLILGRKTWPVNLQQGKLSGRQRGTAAKWKPFIL